MKRHRRIFGQVVLCLVTGLLGACSSLPEGYGTVYEVNGQRQEQDVRNHYERGILQLRAGRIGLALHDLRLALREEPMSVRTLNAIAICYDELNRFDVSRMYYERSLQLEPASVQTLNNLARSALRQGMPERALAYLEQAREFDGTNEVVQANLRDTRQRSAAASRPRPEAGTARAASAEDGPSRRSWIERTSSMVQTLVTSPPKDGSDADRPHAPAVSYHAPGFEAPDSEARLLGGAGSRRGGSELLGHTQYAMLDPGVPAKRNRRIASPLIPVTSQPLEPLPGHRASGPRWTAGNDTGGSRHTEGEAPEAFTLQVSNGAGRTRMARRMADYLAARNLPATRLTNADSFDYGESRLFYRPGHEAAARRTAAVLPAPVELEERANQYDDVTLQLGRDLLEFDSSLLSANGGS